MKEAIQADVLKRRFILETNPMFCMRASITLGGNVRYLSQPYSSIC